MNCASCGGNSLPSARGKWKTQETEAVEAALDAHLMRNFNLSRDSEEFKSFLRGPEYYAEERGEAKQAKWQPDN